MNYTSKAAEAGHQLQNLFERVMAQYASLVTPSAPLAPGSARTLFEDVFTAISARLSESETVKAFPHITVRWSIGQGTWAESPWIGLFDERETTRPHKGLYVVYLFRRDMSAVYLAINEGVTEADIQAVDGSRGLKALYQRSEALRPKFAAIRRYGFRLDDQTDLRGKSRAKKYQASVIAYKMYERSRVPADDQLFADIHGILDVFTQYIEGRSTDAPAEDTRVSRYLRIGVNDTTQWNDWHTQGHATGTWDEVGILREAAPGDIILATRGTREILATGTVQPPGYQWLLNQHTVPVNWDSTLPRRIPSQPDWANAPITEISDALFQELMAAVQPDLDLKRIVTEFSSALTASHLNYGQDDHEKVVRSFVTALATKRLAILTGLSGSGKTQIALRFGDWLGPGQSLLVPVRPDWTGAEALFGYVDGLVPATPDGRRTWFVPKPLEFMLKAARDKANPYLLILDEMNLAHVERYFADVLSGIESDEPCLPNLVQEDGVWRDAPEGDDLLPLPDNLFIVGTVNVDETTYMFSPKVLDRANTFEFRVKDTDLSAEARKPERCRPGDLALTRGFLALASDQTYHLDHPATNLASLTESLKALHKILAGANLEFGHRLFFEAVRFAALMQAAGADPTHTLDRVVMQKILPRIHGTRRKLEDTVRTLGRYCFDLTYDAKSVQFDPEKPPKDSDPALPDSFDKVQRMMQGLLANQFASFVE